MTSALGNYIHKNVQNYIKYGTAKTGELSCESLIISYKAQQIQNNERINALNNTENNSLIEKIGNYIRIETVKSTATRESIYNKDFLQITDDIMLKFLKDCGDYTQNKKAQQIQFQSTKGTIQKLIDKQKEIYKQIEEINKNPLNSQKSLNKLLKNFEKFKELALYDKQLYNTQMNTIITNKNMSTTDQIKQIMKQIVIKEIDDATLKGAFGEHLFSTIANKITKSKDDALKELTAEVVGEQTSSFQVTTRQVPENFSLRLNNFYQSHSSQNKIDVSITVNDNTKLGASIKTYTSKGNTIRAHLQDINLLYNLLATASQFGNHWINLHSLGRINSNILGVKRKDVDLELKKQIIYEALTSGNLLKEKASAANIFVAIDIKTGRVYYNSTYNILNNMINKFNISPKIETLNFRKINQGNYKDTNQRISALLAKIHQTKLKVVFNIPLDPIKTT